MKIVLIVLLFTIKIDSYAQIFDTQQEISWSSRYAKFAQGADLDMDGDIDVLCASESNDKIAWYENDGSGNFIIQHPISYNTDGAFSVYAADLDGDGDLDVLSASKGDNKIAWYENDGNGNFDVQNVISINALSARSVYSVDLDDDGDSDVLSASFDDNKIAWYENDGNGNFSSETVISNETDGASCVFASDLNGDGNIDVLSASALGDKIAWHPNDGEGNFGDPIVISVETEGASSVYASDLDGDGDLDVISTSYGDDKVAWYQNDGEGNFSSQLLINTNAEGPRSARAADIDGDGLLDVVFASNWFTIYSRVAWHRNLGNGSFGYQQIIASYETSGAGSIDVSDLNGNGSLDVLATFLYDGDVAWYENLGQGEFGSQQVITFDRDEKDLSFSDLDSDGDIDIVVSNNYESEIVWFENQNGNSFERMKVIVENIDTPYSIFLADLNGDGAKDLLSASLHDHEISWYENDGSAIFGGQNVISNQVDFANLVRASDLDGDGDLDVISSSYGGWGNQDDDKIAWYENDGNGNFGEQQIITTESDNVFSIYFVDLDGDSDVDLLSASSNDNKITWYENDGNGSFSSEIIISSSVYGAIKVLSSDLDNDGDLDVISAGQDQNIIAWFKNDGLGNFSSAEVIPSSLESLRSIYTSDIDSDGTIDVIAASSLNGIYIFDNDGVGNFGFQKKINDEEYGAFEIITTDLDNDEDQDIVSLGQYGVSFNRNQLGVGCLDTSACNYDSLAWIDGEICCYGICGCQDPTAINFDSTVDCEDGSCNYLIGCTNSIATNYNPEVTHEDGSCYYTINGVVFFDNNGNGELEPEDYGLSFQTVTLEEFGQTVITNNDGEFQFTVSEYSTISLEESELFPYLFSDNPQFFHPYESQNDTIYFAISNEIPEFEISIDFYPSGNGFLCNDWSMHNICFRNMGNFPIDGILELEYDSLFQGYEEVTPIDSIVDSKLYMSYDSLLPGQMKFYDINLNTPLAEHIGDSIFSNVKIYGYHDNEQVAYGEKELPMEITCSYDPNDKQVFPLGYTDNHWLLGQTEQEFLIRFQNTGNAPAQNVVIIDTIDINFDLSTFQLVANSHSVMTMIKEEDHVVEFYFENIQLPDSVNNEPESHGLVSYVVTPYADLPEGTVLENTAYIYFDNNDPIITNTTWTTIHECGGEADFEASETEVCSGEEIEFTSSYEHLETFQWMVNMELSGHEEHYSYIFNEPGDNTVHFLAANPLCNASTDLIVTVLEGPSGEFNVSSIELCEDELLEGTVYNSNQESFTWILDGESIGEELELVLENLDPGDHELSMIISNEFCEREQQQNFSVYSYPTIELNFFTEEFCENDSVIAHAFSENAELFSWVLNDMLIGNESSLNIDSISAGDYELTLLALNGVCESAEAIEFTVHENPPANFNLFATEFCEDETIETQLINESAEVFSWNLNGELIGNESSLNIDSISAGDYELTLFTINQFCEGTEVAEFTVYENPSSDFSSSAEGVCPEGIIEFTGTGDNVQFYLWLVDGEEVGSEEVLIQTFDESGIAEVELITTNGICIDSVTQVIEVYTAPIAQITENGTMLVVNESSSYQWLLNGELIKGATNQAHEVLEDGSYSVIIVDENGCTTQSEVVFIVNISEQDSPIILLYPNPLTDVAYLEFNNSVIRTITLLDPLGKEVRRWENTSTTRLEIQKLDLSTGSYVIQVNEGGILFKQILLIE